MSAFDYIAYREGVLFTKWGPCCCVVPEANDCVACAHAAALDEAGLDWEVERDKARAAKETANG